MRGSATGARPPAAATGVDRGGRFGRALLPDFYAYRYGARDLFPPDASPEAPVFPCETDPATPLPADPLRVAWRAGLDLNPLDVADPAQVAWLETLVWPEQAGRLARLRAALRVARAHRPLLVRGDLRHDVPALAAKAPREATLVVFHTAVLGYVPDRADRDAFAASVGTVCDYWVANESPRVLPGPAACHGDVPRGRFLISVNGAAVAWADPHGTALDWLADPPGPNRRVGSR